MRDGGLVAVRGVAGLDAFAEGGVGDVGDGFHVDGLGGSEGAGAEGAAGGATAGDGGEEDAAVRGARVPCVGGEGGGVVDWEVRAAEDAELDGAVFDEREADGVLAAAEEAHGAVDGVEGPDAAVGAAGAVAGVDGLEHLVFGFEGAAEGGLGGFVGEADGLYEVPDLAGEVGVFS